MCVPLIGVLRLVRRDVGGGADECPCLGEILDLARRNQLQGDIAEDGCLNGSREDGASARVCRELGEEPALDAAADEMDLVVVFARE